MALTLLPESTSGDDRDLAPRRSRDVRQGVEATVPEGEVAVYLVGDYRHAVFPRERDNAGKVLPAEHGAGGIGRIVN